MHSSRHGKRRCIQRNRSYADQECCYYAWSFNTQQTAETGSRKFQQDFQGDFAFDDSSQGEKTSNTPAFLGSDQLIHVPKHTYQVIEKIECYWDERAPEYHSRRNSSFSLSQTSSLDGSDRDNLFDDEVDKSVHATPQIPQNIKDKVNLLNDMNRDVPSDHFGVMIDTSTMELTSTHRALYAETVPDVCIIFADIVNFSKISLDMKPIQVMDMLQDIFSRFDALCDHHGIQKLETIGDAYICTTSMFDEAAGRKSPNAAANALHMAKDMVKEARKVIARTKPIQTLEIRVGIHCGDLTYGVLGERLPKFTVFGSSVNLAARMEQTCVPNRIRVTKDFFDLLPESETLRVDAKEVISVKNMGEVETYLLDPLQDNLENSSRALYD